MTERDPRLEPFEALIGAWTTEAVHPELDAVVPGRVTFEWLEGCRFLVQRSRNDHECFPDSISVIGAPESGEGLTMEYFDSRGVRRTYGVSFEAGVLRMWRDDPSFPQRFSAAPAPDAFEGLWQTGTDDGGMDDLQVTYRRSLTRGLELFAGLRVGDFAAALEWYERLLGNPAFLPHATEAVWNLAGGRSVYVCEDVPAGGGLVTLFVEDLDAQVAEIAARGLDPDERETYGNGVRKAVYRDADGNEIGFGGAPA